MITTQGNSIPREVRMVTTHLDNFKTQQKELHQQAVQYRLVKSLKKPNLWMASIYKAIGRSLIIFGEQLLSRTQAAH